VGEGDGVGPSNVLLTHELARAWYVERHRERRGEEEMPEAWRRWYRSRYGTEHMEQIIADARALVDATPAPTPRRRVRRIMRGGSR
jgi:hypothetical protein